MKISRFDKKYQDYLKNKKLQFFLDDLKSDERERKRKRKK